MKPLPPDNTTTASEAYLAHLCRRTFLHMWSYPGLYQNKGRKGAGHGKELCDLAVVFGSDVILFSDKNCQLRLEPSPEVGWSRWYRKAVIAAADQLVGAERWIANNPLRVFLDRACTQPLPIKFPTNARIHRVVTCRGASHASLAAFGGTGSLLLTNDRIDACVNRPLHLGAFHQDGRMFHVLDEVALDVLFATLDTVSDLRDYLEERERFFQAHEGILAAGEEELLGLYLKHFSKQTNRHYFKIGDDPTKHTHVVITEGFWDAWLSSPARAAKVEADEISYCWDRLAEKFAFHIQTATQHYTTHEGVAENEELLRWMAREPRVRRRMLARHLVGGMDSTPVGEVRRQMVLPSNPGDPHWVFLILPRSPDVPPSRYREMRREYLQWLCCVAKRMYPDALDIVGIAVEPNPDEISEDLIYIDARHWTAELDAAAAMFQQKIGAFIAPPANRGVEYEFPVDPPDHTETR